MLKNSISSILAKPELKYGLHKYLIIKDKFEYYKSKSSAAYRTKPLKDDELFKQAFCEFYGLGGPQYNEEFKEKYFSIFDDYLKAYRKTGKVPSFADVLTKLNAINGKEQIVFATKIIHTFDENLPIYDSVVGKEHFGFDRKGFVYSLYKSEFDKYVKSADGKKIIEEFNKVFPKTGVSDTKIIDFVLWQDR